MIITTIEIPDGLHPDLCHLAMAVLRGDESAAMPLVDCCLENWKGKERITPAYVEALEDELREIRKLIRQGEARNDDPYSTDCILYGKESADILMRLFNLERMARQLGRCGLS